MVDEHSLVTLFHSLADQDYPPILELLNIDHVPVGALYLSELRYKNFTISDTDNSEKYYLVVNGVGIYFSYFQKINL